MIFASTIVQCYALIQEQVDDGIEVDGSNLSGVSGQCLWEDTSCKTGADSSHQGTARCSDDDGKESLQISHHCEHRHTYVMVSLEVDRKVALTRTRN